MKKGKYTEKQFLEYLDRVLASDDVSLGDDASDEVRSALEFARKMLASRDEPSSDFRTNLRYRLQRRIAEEEAAATTPSKTGESWEWMSNLFSHRRALIGVTSTVLAVLLILVGTFWYYSSDIGKPVTISEAPLPPSAEAPSPPAGYSASLPSNIAPERVTFVTKTPLSTTTGEVSVYRVESAQVTTESVTELGRRIGFDNEARFIDSGDRIAMFDGKGDDMKKLIVWTTSGAVEYGYVEPAKLYPTYSPDLPSQQEAELIAYDFLKQADLLPPDYKSFSKIEGDIIAIAGDSYDISTMYTGKTAQQSPAYWLVSFPYFVDGMEATGPGSKIEVTIGNSGEVTRFFAAWRQMSTISDLNIISQKQAYEDLIQGKGSIDIPLNSRQVIIENVQLKYWLDPPSEKQDYVMPVYEFTGQCLDKSGKHLEDFTAWTQALPNIY